MKYLKYFESEIDWVGQRKIDYYGNVSPNTTLKDVQDEFRRILSLGNVPINEFRMLIFNHLDKIKSDGDMLYKSAIENNRKDLVDFLWFHRVGLKKETIDTNGSEVEFFKNIVKYSTRLSSEDKLSMLKFITSLPISRMTNTDDINKYIDDNSSDL